MEEPKSGQIYRHFKGGMYMVIGVAKFAMQTHESLIASNYHPYLKVIRTDTGTTTWIFRKDDELVHNCICCHPLVIYTGKGEVHGKEVSYFMEPDRFELVEVE